MEAIKKVILSASELSVSTETRESGEVAIFEQKIKMEASQPSELNGLIKLATGVQNRSRKFTTPVKNVNLESFDLKKNFIVQIISNRPIGVSANSASFEKQVKFQRMMNNDEPILDANGNQLYHIFALSENNYDLSIRYKDDEKVDELTKANEILGIQDFEGTKVLSNEGEEMF